jgi:hypothetical protein
LARSSSHKCRHLEGLNAGRCAQAATIPPVTVVPTAARAATRRVSLHPCFLGVVVSVYNALAHSF